MVDPKIEADVWKRVMSCPADQGQELTPEQVMELLTQELKGVCTYETLACRMRGQSAQRLRLLAAQERQHYRQLETIYYLRTGAKPCPDRPKMPCIACITEQLRRCYHDEIAAADRYSHLAQNAGSFASTLRCMAQEEQQHAQSILQILQSCL